MLLVLSALPAVCLYLDLDLVAGWLLVGYDVVHRPVLDLEKAHQIGMRNAGVVPISAHTGGRERERERERASKRGFGEGHGCRKKGRKVRVGLG